MEKENNNGKKKLLSAFFMLLITIIALSTASYAWFTENVNVGVNDIQVNVNATGGIQISSDAITWRTALSNDHIKTGYTGTYTDTNVVPENIVPVSTGGVVTTAPTDNATCTALSGTWSGTACTGYITDHVGALQLFKGTVVDNGNNGFELISERSSEIETSGTCSNAAITNRTACLAASGTWTHTDSRGDFIVFDMFILADGATATTLYLTPTAGVTNSGGNLGLQNAARFAFINEGNVPAGSAATVAQPLRNGTTSIIWEPNNNEHVATAITHALSAYGQTITATQTIGTYDGLIAEFTAADDVPVNATSTSHSTYFQAVTPAPSTNVVHAANTTLMTVQPGISKIRVYAWIEGQDYDCENNASGSKVTFNISLSKNNS